MVSSYVSLLSPSLPQPQGPSPLVVGPSHPWPLAATNDLTVVGHPPAMDDTPSSLLSFPPVVPTLSRSWAVMASPAVAPLPPSIAVTLLVGAPPYVPAVVLHLAPPTGHPPSTAYALAADSSRGQCACTRRARPRHTRGGQVYLPTPPPAPPPANLLSRRRPPPSWPAPTTGHGRPYSLPADAQDGAIASQADTAAHKLVRGFLDAASPCLPLVALPQAPSPTVSTP